MLKLFALFTLVQVLDVVKCFIPHSVALPKKRWIEKSSVLGMSGVDDAASTSKTLHHVAVKNSVAGKSWLRCKPIGGMCSF